MFSQVNCVCIAGILAPRFLFSILWCSHTGYHSQEELAKFGYRSERKVEKCKNTAIFSWSVGIYWLNKVISEKNSSETGDFGAFFSQNSFVWVVLNFFCVHFSWVQIISKMQYEASNMLPFLTDQIKCQFTFIQILLTLVICLLLAIQL